MREREREVGGGGGGGRDEMFVNAAYILNHLTHQ